MNMNLNLVCRTCLQINMKCVNLFYYSVKSKILAEMLMDCASIKVKEGDGLPCHICTICRTKLTSLWNFRQLVLESEMILRRNCDTTLFDEANVKEQPYICNFESLELHPTADQRTCFEESGTDECVQKQDLLMSVNKALDPLAMSVSDTYNILKEENNFEIQENNMNLADDQIKSDTIVDIEESSKYSGSEMQSKENQHLDNINNLQSRPSNKLVTNTNALKRNCEYLDGSNNLTTENDKIKFTVSKELSENERKKNVNLKKVQCKECNKVFSRNYYQQVHVYYHNGGRIIVCTICDKTFGSDRQLKKHRIMHKGRCNLCGEVFESEFKLRSHQTIHIAEHHTCHICNKQIRGLKHFRKHVSDHEKRFMCELCGKSYTRLDTLNLHRSVHSTARVIPCPTCGKDFATERRLKRHLLWHVEGKPFSCDYCNKAFKTSDAKRKHIFVHTGERPYSCRICEKKFSQSRTLSLHMLTHTGETPFSCDKCTYKCKYKQQFDNHMKKHKRK